MKIKRYILLLLSVFCSCIAIAQSDLTQSRILILLDESSSMIQPWAGGMEKYKAADSLILRLMDSVYAVNPDVEFSLRVFGHQHTVEENNCTDTKNEVPFSKDNRVQMAFRLADIHPLGVTPIAYALEQAADYDLTDENRNAYSIILITDGGESCGGDICEVMQKLIRNKVFFKPYIVSLENDPALRTTYSCMGDYLQVTGKKDINPAVSTIVTAFRPVLKITKADYKELQVIAANAPSVLKVNIPVMVNTEDTEAPAKTTVSEVTDLHPMKTFPDTTHPKPVIVSPPSVIPVPAKPKADTIVIAPRPILKPVEPQKDTIAAAQPPVKPPHHIVTHDTPEPVKKLSRLEPAALHTFNVVQHSGEKAKLITPPSILPPLVTADTTVAAHKLARLMPAPLKSFNSPQHAPEKAKIMTAPSVLPAVRIDDTVAATPKLARLKPARMRNFNVLFIVEDRIFTQRKIPALPPVKYGDLTPRTDSKVPIPRKQPVPPGKRGGYTVETEDAKETSLAIYFTDGAGRFYTSTPQMVMVEPISSKIVKRFYRTVDANGEPDPQKDVPEGTYDIAVSGSRSLIIHDVDIIKNKKNKLIIKIKKSSIRFVYLDAPNRPVKEFIATITERDKPNGKVVTQKCTEELMYEPGNYHIDINTFPRDVRNTDLDLDDETTILIAQPGFAKFTAEGNTRVASLYLKDGDRFLPFFTLDLSDPTSQHLQIQPGEYQAHYHTGPGRANAASEKVVRFIIKATEETEVILK